MPITGNNNAMNFTDASYHTVRNTTDNYKSSENNTTSLSCSFISSSPVITSTTTTTTTTTTSTANTTPSPIPASPPAALMRSIACSTVSPTTTVQSNINYPSMDRDQLPVQLSDSLGRIPVINVRCNCCVNFIVMYSLFFCVFSLLLSTSLTS